MTTPKTKTTKEYRFVGNHPETLSDGRTLEPGAYYDLEDSVVKDPENLHLSEGGRLLAVPEGGKD